MSDAAFRVYVTLLSYAADLPGTPTGFLTEVEVAAHLKARGVKPAIVKELVDLNAWEKAEGGGYKIHDFEEYAYHSDVIRSRRLYSSIKAAGLSRAQVEALRQRIFERDHFTCRYCGAQPEPRWLVTDHVVPTPDGEMNEDNLVTCCRSCNRKKGGRTPEQAGLRLRLESPNGLTHIKEGTLRGTPSRDGIPDPEPEPVPVVLTAPPLPPRLQTKRGDASENGYDDATYELAQGMHDVLGHQLSGIELIECQGALNQYAYLTPADLIDRARGHIEHCESQEPKLPTPRTVAGFAHTWRLENDHRADSGMPKAARVQLGRRGGMTHIGDLTKELQP